MKRLMGMFVVVSLLASPVMGATFKATISWVDNSDNETGFRVERALVPAGPYIEVGSVGIDQTAYVDQPINPGESYCWRIVAFNLAGDASPSREACAAAPDFPAAAGGTQVIITLAP